MKTLIFILTASLAGFTAQAEMLDANPSSPYAKFQKATGAEKQQLLAEFDKWAVANTKSQTERQALMSLISEDPDMSGDGVLEVLDQSVIDWFYGYKVDETASLEQLLQKVKQVGSISEATCKSSYRLCVIVSKSRQRLTAYEYGRPVAGLTDIKVSTARPGKYTPTGTFTIGEIANKNRRSNLYDGAYLGYAMQLHGNIFIHATSTDHYKQLGRPASAGCVRLHLQHAGPLNGLMRSVGRGNIRVIIK